MAPQTPTTPAINQVMKLGTAMYPNISAQLVDELYEDHDKPVPSANVVLFLSGRRSTSRKTLRSDSWVNTCASSAAKNRVIRGQDEITSARSSKKTKN